MRPRSTPLPPSLASAPKDVQPSLAGHLDIARVNHWIKNVFMLPGIAVALSVRPLHAGWPLARDCLIGFLAICLVASSNYVLNEILDAPYDAQHPVKRFRPVPGGRVNVPLAYVEWLVLGAAGLFTGALVSPHFVLTLAALWLMSGLYNVRPVRTKDVPYLDVLSESINNPLRFLAGWFIVDPPEIPPASLLLSYWMIGAYFMAIKRFAEYRDVADIDILERYRRSFRHYSEPRLLVSIMFYGSASMLFLGAFTFRYRLELIAAFPLVALVMAVYLSIAFKQASPAQAPERLWREPGLMLAVTACAVAMTALFFLDIPVLRRIFAPTM